MVNELIIEAMQKEPVCLTLIRTRGDTLRTTRPLGGERTRSDDGRRLLLSVRRRLVVGLLGLVLGLLRVLASDLRRVGRGQHAHSRTSAAGRRARTRRGSSTVLHSRSSGQVRTQKRRFASPWTRSSSSGRIHAPAQPRKVDALRRPRGFAPFIAGAVPSAFASVLLG